MKNSSWIPKLKIVSKNGFFIEQILRVIDENNIAVDLLEDDEDEDLENDFLILIADHILSDEEELSPTYILYVLPEEIPIVESSEKRIVFYQRSLRESELATKIEDITLMLMSQTKHSKVIKDLSTKAVEAASIVKDYNTQMEDAQYAQISIMKPPQNMGDFETYSVYVPFRTISGDVLFVKQVYDKIFIMVADVTDHGYLAGMYGATLYALANNYVQTSSLADQDVSVWANYMQRMSKMFYPETIDKTNKVKLNDLLTANATFAIINKSKNYVDMCFCGSGGEPPILVKNGQNTKAEMIKIDPQNGVSAPLGNGTNLAPPKRKKFFPGDQLIFYTDGATEIFLDSADTGEKDAKKIFSSEKIVKSVNEAIFKNKTKPNELVDFILNDAAAYSISADISKNKDIPNLDDDITIFCIKWRRNGLD